ncbi:conserved protein of unknown function [Kingella kingae]|uniref:Uncharacterized protein n=1 Tax=Kingella kingae ATCC 23330 TaxID=887327 RepID=F5S8V4_KINKI|nr:hypothetical protein HMPREF0476_1637 [Kingella kingae ATCC 23330]CRZ19233.1 conserved protein of unknown function [Kingella kingae]
MNAIATLCLLRYFIKKQIKQLIINVIFLFAPIKKSIFSELYHVRLNG